MPKAPRDLQPRTGTPPADGPQPLLAAEPSSDTILHAAVFGLTHHRSTAPVVLKTRNDAEAGRFAGEVERCAKPRNLGASFTT